MISACVFAVLLEHPGSPIHMTIESSLLRRALAGLAMALTLLAIIFSPLGQRSGAHLNPVITLNYWLLGKVRGSDALAYVCAQFAGGIAGIFASDFMIGFPIRNSAVNYAATVPGSLGPGGAFAGELFISFGMMFAVLFFTNHPRWAYATPFVAATLVALYITFEAPLSGMSMNPARTLASAIGASEWTALWVYFAAPPLGMVLAALIYTARFGRNSVLCAKLHHDNPRRCIFRCAYREQRTRAAAA